MNDYPQGRTDPAFSQRPNSRWIPIPAAGYTAKGWNFLPLAPGLFGTYFAYGLYPLLHGYALLLVVVFLFFLLAGLIPRVSVLSGLALALLAATLLLNGALDRVPPVEVKATVIRKAMVSGDLKRGTHYQLSVSSWRAGRSQEDLEVDSGVFNRTAVGKIVAVEFHKGFLGLPWYGNISTE